MPRYIFLDFETRSRSDIGKVGADCYAQDRSTTLLCLAYAIDEGPVEGWSPGQPSPAWMTSIEPGDLVVAHNASFERAVWNGVGPRFGWSSVQLDQWYCTAARCAAAGLPRSLDGAARAIGLSVKKDHEGRRLMLKHCKPRKPTANNPSEWEDDPAEARKIFEYCMTDVEVERALLHATPPLGELERANWLLDQRINDIGVPIDVPTATTIVGRLAEYERELSASLVKLTSGEVTAATQVNRLLTWLQRNGCDIGDLTAPTVRQQLGRTDLEPTIRQVLRVREQIGRASVAKYSAMIERTDGDGRARGCHVYYGAHTGRWAGRGIQLQNVPRGKIHEAEIEPAIETLCRSGVAALGLCYHDPMDVAVSLIRPMIKAPRGRKLVVCDFASIEARVLAWLADQADLVKVFEANGDVYKQFTSVVYGITEDQVTKEQRQVGKVAVLGLGYGMGWEKFRATCQKFGVLIDDVMAHEVVDTYRDLYGSITAYWKRVERAAHASTANGLGVVDKRVRFAIEELGGRRWLRCVLPRGRALAYYDPQIRQVEKSWGKVDSLSYMHEDAVQHQWCRTDTYGGKLVENIVQAVARDILADTLRRLERAGFRVVLHIHDEVVVECNANRSDALAEVEQILRERPSWAAGCPIDCEGFECERYRK